MIVESKRDSGHKVAIMQPYFFPYQGYYNLISSADTFVVYDNIKFVKGSWINRNRILGETGGPAYISIPLKKDSDFLQIRDREISESFSPKKFTNAIATKYRRASNFKEGMEIVSSIVDFAHSNRNLFEFLYRSIIEVSTYLDIQTKILVSSEIESFPDAKGEDRVLSICGDLNAKIYINPPGGRDLYKHKDFSEKGIELKFMVPNLNNYNQVRGGFVSGLSIVDLILSVSRDELIDRVRSNYTLQ
jgi:hypothetical protein